MLIVETQNNPSVEIIDKWNFFVWNNVEKDSDLKNRNKV